MKEATIYKTFAAILAVIAGAALVAVFLGHLCHIFTPLALGSLAVVLDGEAEHIEKNENSKTIEQ